jgi:hypothetical protein
VIASRVIDEIEARPSFEEIESSMAFPEMDRRAYLDAASYLWNRADRAERDGLLMVSTSAHYARFIALLLQRAVADQ